MTAQLVPPLAGRDDPSTRQPEVHVAPRRREVVAVVIRHAGDICLLRRSSGVGHDRGLWHCVTGYVEADVDPVEQARRELLEETGLRADRDLDSLVRAWSLRIPDRRGGSWVVHPFLATSRSRTIRLDWEHDAYRWVGWPALPARDQVAWLPTILRCFSPAPVQAQAS